MDFKPYIQKIAHVTGKKLADVGETQPFKAYLGDGTGTGNIRNANGPYQRMVNYWRDTTEGREVGTAILDSNASIPWSNITSQENTEVIVAYPARSKVPYAMRISREGTNQFPGGGISPTEQQASAAGYPFLRDVQDFRASVQVPASIEAQVSGGLYLSSVGVLTPWLGDNTSHATTTLLSIQVALAAGKHCIAWILFDTSTGLLNAIGTTAVTAFGSLPSRSEFDLPSQFVITTGLYEFRLVPVYLYYGQTGLIEADFYRSYDSREKLGSNSTVDTDYYQTVQVNGTPMTQRSKLDLIAGTNITLTPVDDAGGDRSKVTVDSTGGGGVTLPKIARMWGDSFKVITGNAYTRTHDTRNNYAFTQYQSPPANGDAFDCGCFIDAGTYTLTFLCYTASDHGKLDVYLNGSGSPAVTGIDFGGGGGFNSIVTASITILTGGYNKFHFVVNGTSGSNYYIEIIYADLIPSSF